MICASVTDYNHTKVPKLESLNDLDVDKMVQLRIESLCYSGNLTLNNLGITMNNGAYIQALPDVCYYKRQLPTQLQWIRVRFTEDEKKIFQIQFFGKTSLMLAGEYQDQKGRVEEFVLEKDEVLCGCTLYHT